MKLLCLLIFSITLPLCVMAKETSVSYQIISSDKSLTSEAKNNVTLFLKEIDVKDRHNISYWRKRIIKQCTSALQAVGYYAATFEITTDKTANKFDANIDIKLGQPTLLTSAKFVLQGSGKHDPNFLKLKNSFALIKGSKINHGQFEDNKAAFSILALEQGYFDGKWIRSEVKVNIKQNNAQLDLIYNTGQRYVFGDVLVLGFTPATTIIKQMAPFLRGDAYNSNKLALFNLSLNQSQYFSSVQAVPTPPNSQDGRVDILVTVQKRPTHIVELAGGITSDLGARSRFKWTKPWFNDLGHSVASELKLGREERSFIADYKIPKGDPTRNFTKLILGWQRSKVLNDAYKKYSLQWQRHTTTSKDWRRIVSVKLEQEHNLDVGKISKIILPGISFSRIRRQGGIAIDWGDRQSYALEVSDKVWGSTASFAKFSLHSNWLRTINGTHQLLFKFELGAIIADSIDEVPTSLRFYSGGDENLRAYDYKSVSPLVTLDDNSKEARGGLYQVLATAEYSYPIVENWRIATFYDVGTTTDDFSESLKSDMGIGLRWQTPVGKIRLDFAFGLQSNDHKPYDYPSHISLAIGLDL